MWTEHAKAGVAYGVLFAYDSWIVFHDAGSYIEVSNVYTRRDESLAPKLANEIVVSSTSTAPVSQAPTTETSVSTPEGSGVPDIGRGPGSAGPSNPKAQTAHADLGDIDPLSTPVLLFITMSLLPPELFLPVEDKRPRKPSGPLNRQSKRLRRDEPGQVAENEQDAEGGGGGEGEEEERAGREVCYRGSHVYDTHFITSPIVRDGAVFLIRTMIVWYAFLLARVTS